MPIRTSSSARRSPLTQRRLGLLTGLFAGLLTAALLGLPTAARAELEIEIAGVADDAVAEQLRNWLGQPAGDSAADIAAFRRVLPKEAAKALRAVGYYGAAVDSTLSGDDDEPQLLIEVDLGQPVRLVEPDLRIRGPAAAHPAFVELLADPGLAAGQRLDHGAYESLKGRLLDQAQALGFFDAELTAHSIEVDLAAGEAQIHLHLTGGPRYRIGEISWDHPPIDPARMQAWLPIERGQPYAARRIAATHKALLDAGYFRDVRVRVLRHQRRRDGEHPEVPLYVQLTPREENEVGFGLGFATDSGARARVNWTRPHINRRGHSLHSQLYLSQIGHHASVRYRMPDALQPKTHYDQIELGSRAEQVEDSDSTLSSIALQRIGLLDSGWQRSRSLRFESETFTLGAPTQTTKLLLPGIGWSRTERRGDLYATSGARYSLRLAAGHSDLGSDIDMVEINAGAKWLASRGENNQFIIRTEAGAVHSDDFARLPSSHRFYVGGDQSVRGYAYKSLGPKNADGELIGGEQMLSGSLEYVRFVVGNFGLALFADAGKAFSNSAEPVHLGAGFGLRWRSPVGPLRVDIGFPIDDDEHDTPRLHLSIGPEL